MVEFHRFCLSIVCIACRHHSYIESLPTLWLASACDVIASCTLLNCPTSKRWWHDLKLEHGSSNIVGIEEPSRLNVVCPLRFPSSSIALHLFEEPSPGSPKKHQDKTTVWLVTTSTTSNLHVRATCPLLHSAKDYSIIAHHWKWLGKNSGRRSPGIEAEGSTIVY